MRLRELHGPHTHLLGTMLILMAATVALVMLLSGVQWTSSGPLVGLDFGAALVVLGVLTYVLVAIGIAAVSAASYLSTVVHRHRDQHHV